MLLDVLLDAVLLDVAVLLDDAPPPPLLDDAVVPAPPVPVSPLPLQPTATTIPRAQAMRIEVMNPL